MHAGVDKKEVLEEQERQEASLHHFETKVDLRLRSQDSVTLILEVNLRHRSIVICGIIRISTVGIRTGGGIPLQGRGVSPGRDECGGSAGGREGSGTGRGSGRASGGMFYL